MELKYIPTIKYMIPRPRISNLMREAVSYSVVSIVAPPGYGKSIAVSEFCRLEKNAVIWMHCVTMDNDLERFWNSFINAVRQQLPACAESLELLKFPASIKEYDSVIRIILDAARSQKIIMVFDNLEHIHSLQIFQFINIIIEAESPDLCVIIISNQRLLTRFSPKSSNRRHISEAELVFTSDESRQLSEQFGLSLPQTEIDSINKSVNGWPYPLHLVFMELKHHEQIPYSNAVMQQLVFERFEQHYYQNYSFKIQKIFIICSLLPRISLSLIMELGIEIDEEIMQTLMDNIFICYDSKTQIYSLSKLYQDFLYSKRELFSKDEIYQIIDRSGNWYLENDKFHEALASFWINRDYDKYLNALSHLYVKYHDYDTTQHILKILNQFPAEYCEKNVIVTYSRAFFYLNIMQLQKGRQILLEMIPNLLNQPVEQTMLGNIFYSLADISNLRNDDKGLAYIQKAMELLPHGCNLRYRELLIVENNELFFLPDTKSGRLEEMIEYQIEFAKCADFLCNGSGMGYEMQFAAEACYFSGQFTRALEYAQRAESKAAIEHQYDIICNALFIKMRIALFTGNLKTALGYLDEITYYSQQLNLSIIDAIRDYAKCWLYISIGYPEKIEDEIQALINQKEIRYLGRANIIIAIYYYTQQKYAEAFCVVIQLNEILKEKGLWVTRVCAHITKALCYEMMDKSDLAMDELWFAYDQCHKNNVWVIFAEYGRYLSLLIKVARKQTRYQFDSLWWDRIEGEAIANSNRKHAMFKSLQGKKMANQIRSLALTEREKLVLHNLASGLTQKESAGAMGITVNGVKKHICNIYSKLGAENRVDAIRIAIVNGLLDD